MNVTPAADSSITELTNFFHASRFLAWEAKLLDERRFEEWLELMDDNIVYEVPIRIARTDFSEETSSGACRICDSKKMLRARVEKLRCGHCWSESPPSRTLRVVGSVIITASEFDVLEVESALIIHRQRREDEPGQVLPVRRVDRLRLARGGARLLRRRALISQTVLHTPNLGIFL